MADADKGNLSEELVAARKDFLSALLRFQDALEYLKLTIKYQSFDLEATRRERDNLKEQLKKYEI
jgi:hypothetical protein